MPENGPPRSGTIIYLPWLQLFRPVQIGKFLFHPFQIDTSIQGIHPQAAETIRSALQINVDLKAVPIEACTIILKADAGSERWNIAPEYSGGVQIAVDILAMSCLAEQRFFEGGVLLT